MEKGTFAIKVGLAEMLKGGVIMDVTNAEQAKIAEDSGASPHPVMTMAKKQIAKSFFMLFPIIGCLGTK